VQVAQKFPCTVVTMIPDCYTYVCKTCLHSFSNVNFFGKIEKGPRLITNNHKDDSKM